MAAYRAQRMQYLHDLYIKNTTTKAMNSSMLQRIALQERVPKSRLALLERELDNVVEKKS